MIRREGSAERQFSGRPEAYCLEDGVPPTGRCAVDRAKPCRSLRCRWEVALRAVGVKLKTTQTYSEAVRSSECEIRIIIDNY